MFDHYLTVGGNEVVNSERSFGYTRTIDCPVFWLDDPKCNTVYDAEQDDDPYDYDDIADAPWYDPDDPDTTGRFLGVYGIEFSGLSDSTRSAVVTERNGDGAQVSGYRHTSREVRVRAWLTAKGEDAMEAGMTWLRNVLEPDACGIHGGSCGEAEAAFFVDCPPEREQIPGYSDWATTAVNRAMNPIADGSWAAMYGTGGAGNITTVTGFAGAPARRLSWTTIPTAGVTGILVSSIIALDNPVTPGEQVQVHIDLASSRAGIALAYTFTDSGGGALTGATTDYQTVSTSPTNPSRVTFVTDPAPAGAAHMAVRFVVPRADLTVGDWITASRMYIGTEDFGYFDGSFTGNEFLDFSWTGSANVAPSVRATRTRVYTPEGDASYYERVDAYRRFLHSVRCISGPFEVQRSISFDHQYVGRLVEFTLLAQVPWIFGLPRDIEVPPLTPTVIQDIAYNLAPYPSAELSSGTTIVATNYATNPSVETDITGWSSSANAAMNAAGTTTIARTTTLAAVGVASALVQFTATAAGTGGQLRVQHLVALAGPSGARYSFNMWGSSAVGSGTASITDMTYAVVWRDASNAEVRIDVMGTMAPSGGALSLASIQPPATATNVLVRVQANVASWNSGAVIRVYGDAVAVTVP